MLSKKLKSYEVQIKELVKQLHELTQDIDNQELSNTVSDLRARIDEPFLFVIVGEVKAGKSSFVNALLESKVEITKTAPQPMTDTVQQIIYGEEPAVISVNPYLKKIFQPIEILKEISIVDTPGTNTIIAHHQEITERFVPSSDLIVFVFEAKNPYRQSAWEFLDFIHDQWRKKIIFVLQQKDLMNEEDLQVNIKGVKDNAHQKGINEPEVFAVSAKLELDDQFDESGFNSIRKYISENITGGRAPILKLMNNVDTGNTINHKILDGVALRRRQYQEDMLFRQDIKSSLDEQSERSKVQSNRLIQSLVDGFERITLRKGVELESELGFFTLLGRTIRGIFVKGKSANERLEEWAKKLEIDLKTDLQNNLDEGVADLAERIQQMAKIIDLKIQNSKTILRNNHEIFSSIADRRAAVLHDLQTTFKSFLSHSENFKDDALLLDSSKISPNLLAGSGLAVVGAILMTVTQGAVLDVTGGILTTIGLLFAGVTTSLKKRKILSGYRKSVKEGKDKLENELNQRLDTYIDNIKEKIDSNFISFDELLDNEAKEIDRLDTAHKSIESELIEIKSELTKLLH